jgi:SAM-dependent methyltransferase
VRLHALARSEVARLSVGRAYDAIAADYDAQVRGDAWMRQQLHARYRRVFRAGDFVLDVGCGTGLDAVFLAEHGLRVLGIDASPEMIARARARIAAAGLGERITVRVQPIERLDELAERQLDGIVSAFASLNALPDLRQFAADAARLVRPRGRLILHLLNRTSLWEWLGYARRGQWRAARALGAAPTRAFSIGGESIQHRLYSPRDVYRDVFAQSFRRRGCVGLGAIRPPHTVRRLPDPLVRALEALDPPLGTLPVVRGLGRFLVLDLERRAP